ncbi:fibronectin type III domain-containing protein [[Eubacterium] siraeum]|uniref:Fibronectin type III domain-containing protein n=1 Tax=[Eubacterium] siraeum TaxID=39492 RepID=A0AAW6CYJ3_9FIRM|nr:fibronectin type III domain-containing protein [[Eubacterium] siraeum]MDB8004056.1 fibronectin type III domain-containing protein [[Eubacterium] siraeum]
MKKKFVRLISAVLSAAMTLTAVPLSAFAEGEAHTHDGESNVITTPLDFREKTADESGDGWSWDHDTKTLTLNGVNIQATTEENMMSVVTVPDGTKIVLNGENTIVQTDTLESDTYVLSAVNNKEVNCDGTMTISGDGVLNAENRSTDSMARSLGGSIILNGGTVNATGTVKTNSLEIHNDGVLNANATTASFEGVAVNVSGGITVDGNGSLTAVGCANESTLNSAILLTSNFGDKISVSENGSITVPEGNAARVGIYYSGNNGDGMDAEISGGKVTAYGAKYGIYKVNLIMSGTGSVYTTGGSYAIGQTVPTIDEDEFVVKGSTESKASESAVTGEVKLNGGYYEIDGADAKTVVIKPDTSPRIILGNQIGIFKTEEYKIIEDIDMTDIKLKGTVYFDITLKNMSDEEFADARGYFGGDEPDLSASIIKTDYGWVCMVCDTEFSVTYDTDNTLTIKCGDIVSNTVQVKSNANRFNKVTQGDNTNRTVFYTNTSQEEKDNYKLVSTYTVDSESISYNWYSTNSAYSADELGAAVSGSNGEFKLADNIPAGNYVLYCDITYSDGDSTETVTEKFTFTYKECAHENGYSDGKCTNCGALCDHSDIDINTGKCNECAHQFVATISTDGNAPTGYDTLADCLDSITAETGNYVKIYQDIGDASATATLDTIDVKHNVMIDLNGHKLNNIKLGVNKDVKLALTGTAGSYVTQVYVRKGGGSFIIDSEANVEFNTIFVEDSARLAVNDGAKVTTEQLTVIASVNDDGTTTTSVKLATGMKLGGLTYHRQNNSGALKLGNLLDVTRQALQREDNGNYLDLYKEYGSMGYSVALTVVEHTDADHKYGSGTGKCEECGKPCEHGGDINTDTGICSICGAVVSVALYTDGDGNLQYVDTDELDSLLNEYNGSGTIKLFKDYSKPSAQYDLYGELTIDLNGRQFKIRSITPCKSGKLTIKNSGNPVMLGCNVYPTNDASYAGGTLIIDGDVVLDTSIYVYDSSTVILKDGTYPAGLYARDSKTLYDMLGEGKAFFKADGTLFNASVKEISSSETLTVKDHSHTYVDGKCDCGYVCPHSDVDSETGKCNECEYQYAAVIVKDGAAASVYKETEMEAAFEAADSDANTGCTLKVYKNYAGSYTTLSRKFTLWIAEEANVGTLTVSGDITVTGSEKNNSIYGDFNVVDGGKLTFDENCGAKGTVSVGAGPFDCYRSLGIILNINDASSDVILHDGAFLKIRYNGGGDRANAEILTLLAENRMFMTSSAVPIDGSKTLLKDGFVTPVIVAPHEDHSYDSTTGKCTICGKRCGHTDVDSKTGVCLTCEYQLTAGVSGVGTAKYFDNIDDAFTAALSEENSGCTLTLYKHCEITQSVEIGNTTVTVDVNGCSLGGEADISVNNGGVLYLKDSRKSTYYGCIDAPFSVNGGTLINGTADGGSSAADVLNLVINSAKCVEIYGGIFENVYIAHASGVALYGGRYNTICGEESNSTPVNDLLAKGYAFATVQEFTTLPESIVDGSAKTIGDGLTNVMVVAHTHTYDETNTKCACGAVLYAKVTSADGTTNEYFDSIEEGLLYADKAENKGCVFTLVTSGKIKDYVTLSNGQFTITAMNNNCVISASGGKICIEGADVIAEGHMLINCSIDMISGSLTLPEGSGTRFGTIIISGGTVNISEGVNADNNAGADKLFIANATTDAKVTIGGGTYGNVAFEMLKLKDVLASGVRVIRYDNSSDPTAEKIVTALLYSDIAEESYLAPGDDDGRYYLFTKCEHKNEDGSYAFNDSGICKYCNSEFAASVSYTVDGSAKTELFGDIYDAFDKANGVGTATVTLYKDITDSERTRDVTVMGNVTLELNGKTLGGRYGIVRISVSDGGTLTVNGDGNMDTPIYVNENSKLVINGGGYFNSVSVKKGGNAEIGGGTIRGLSVRGNVKLSGGKFNDIEIFNGNLESVLADGYAYKVDGGAWLSIAERAESVYSSLNNNDKPLSVEEAPIKSASISWAGGEAPVIYRNGEKYLYVDITYELAVGSRGATYSDFVNGNNRIKDYNLYNKYMVHCYEIGKLAAKDGEVEYYIVLKCNGYEYKSNVLKLTLATCSHPEDSLLYENDGFVICGICDALIEAEVVDADGKSLGYADIESAIKLAQENEGSTVKLMSEGVSESITVTGGRFTVDFNGKKVFYQFDVNGGDVTFTSSVKQADVETLISKIEVTGADAKVTIDGKIKLGSVTLTSGALAVNSAESYIKELLINGGKTVVNGANIDALKANGGDTVINCVEANSLSININGSGSISIVTGEFGSTTCKTGLGMAIASGSVVFGNNINGFTIYTYDAIQTMTKTDRIFVDKCDHKDGKGSYVLDGNPCPYCNEEIVATVSYTTANGGEMTDLFSDIYDAFAKANEVGTATVTLYKDITDDITDTIAVTGNVTLELNGKRLSQPGTDVWYSIEVTSGKLTVNGSGLIKRVAVRNGSNAEINGGTFSDFIIKDGGNAVIKGGQFYSLQVSGEGRNVGQLLADGYAYWNFIDSGIWSTIAEREKQDITNVEVKEAPIKSATITANDESPIIYRNGKKAVTFAADVTYTGNETLYVTGYLIDGTVIKEKTDLSGNRYYLFSGEVDKAVAEDGEIQYYCIFTYDGYEYKSNVVTLTVATCQHPGESVKCDDNGNVCGICNRALTASVELSDGTLSYYGNWNDAISAAQESEGCTLKLLNYSWLKDNETFDISKGRFTVDLNKNDSSGPFAFNVKGGDITFTALKKASISFTGVTVSGENANVLIDSKATLNYLVVNSGKVTVDGANIGTITIKGGDMVINDVNADYLSMKADTTGGSGYNVSIVSGTFNIFTCENESNYTLGRAIASGSRVIGLNAIVGSGFKYAEIQSMTKANYLNVIKCDHKDENDSYALDGNLCPYCNEEIAATVSYTADGGEMTDLFSDIYDAFAKANEAGTATVTLYKDIENSELTQGVTITGNVTLALNGKKLGGTFAFNAPVEVSDGGMFTVGGDGKMRMPIKAYANSKLIINGGEFTSVMVYIDGDAEIGGGVIDALTIIGNAKAKISGGKFYNIEIANGSLESVLADGYAYKKDGGAWLSIAERAESVYSSVNNDNKPVNVEEAPIKSATLSTEINKLYRNSNANPTLKFNLALAHGSNLNDSYVSKRYGINSYVSGDIIYSSLSALVKDAKLSADEIIDKAGNSVAAKIYFVVITDDGYEIKSNTVSIDLVDCDHSQVVDPTADKETAGNITEPTYCEICESKFNAKITKGDDVKYYNNLDEAAKDAQKSENEGCTLYPLYNKNGYGGQLVITEGNFTLKYAVRTAFSRPIIINGKAKLTVTGRCAVTAFENQDAFIVRGGDVTFDGLATGSNVTINGGNVTMAANNINCLTINGGNVSISSGGFAEIITNAPNKVIADYIDPGFWVQDRGTKEWIDIYSLNKATASSTNGLTVRVCPMQIIKPIDTVYYTNGYYPDDIPSLQISAVPWYSGEVDAKVAYQWIGIDENGYETVIEGATDRKLSLENLTTGRYYCRLTYSNATTAGVSMKSDVVTATITECEHSGGEATCTEKAKCEICGAEYGEPLGHDYVVIKVVEPDYRNEGYSVFECTRCKDSYIGNRVPVKPIPDVEEIAVEKTTYNEVDISWKNISGVDGYYVECYVGNQWKQINCSADGDRVAAKLSGLSAGLKYKVRIAAYAGSFTGKYRCFYVDTVPSPVWNINTVKATDETVRISWNRNTRADGYKVEWYIDNQWSVKTVTGNNNIAAVIDGLCAGTRYKVRVSAYKGDLYSPYTYGYINTLPSKVTGITQTVTSSSFTLTWDKNESADGYTVQYYADGKWNEKTLTGNGKTAVTIGSLKGYKTYKVRIKAYKGELQSTFDDIYITTAPTKVSGLKVKSAVDSKAVVIWNADATADGYNVGYYIGGRWLEKTITDNKTAMAVLGGLTPYSTYKVRVRAYKGNLYGDYSYTTVTAVLSPVTDIKVVSAKRNSITVKWGKNASADGYKVEIYKGGKWVKKTLKGSTNATVTIGGLRAGSVYKVRIASYKGANTSTYTYANVNTAK